jgi:hemoglobin
MNESEVYAALGDDGFHRLIAAFYRRVETDDLLGPMYPKDDLDGAQWRLREFLVGRFGGPMRYVEQRGHPRLRMRHMPFKINRAAAERWLKLMDEALVETSVPADVAAVLRPYFLSTAGAMMNQPG